MPDLQPAPPPPTGFERTGWTVIDGHAPLPVTICKTCRWIVLNTTEAISQHYHVCRTLKAADEVPGVLQGVAGGRA